MKMNVGRKLIKRTDVIIIVLVVIVAVLFFYINSSDKGKPTAVITVNGEEIQRIDLSSAVDETFTLDTYPKVTLEIEDSKIRFINSLCPDSTCEKSGFLSKPGDTAACVPAKTVVTIEGSKQSNIDAVAG